MFQDVNCGFDTWVTIRWHEDICRGILRETQTAREGNDAINANTKIGDAPKPPSSPWMNRGVPGYVWDEMEKMTKGSRGLHCGRGGNNK